MRGRYQRPSDMPAACCGRCEWFRPGNAEGNGRCTQWGETRYYKCMVCLEYELSPIN